VGREAEWDAEAPAVSELALDSSTYLPRLASMS